MTRSQTDLSLKLVGEIEGAFWVPAYQCGYRWGREQVELLLRDIWEHVTTTRPGESYCLQPIVVKNRPDGKIELIDGQQRLTTLYLTLLYMKRERLQNFDPPFSIEYETRPVSVADLLERSEASREQNIDFFHLHKCIYLR